MIAERVLKRLTDGALVRICVFQPTVDTHDPNGDWVCRVEIDRGGIMARHRAYGVDALQALTHALANIANDLAGDRTVAWLDAAPGETGLPYIPAWVDADFDQLLRCLVEAEHLRRMHVAKAAEAGARGEGAGHDDNPDGP